MNNDVNRDENIINLENQETELPQRISNKDLITTNEKDIVDSIIESPSKDELQKQIDLFNMAQSKKNALRIVKLNSLLDKIEDQAIERFEKRPDQVSNKELLDYMNTISGQIDRAHRQMDSISETPAVSITTQKNDVTINVVETLDRTSKERVMDAISNLLKQVKGEINAAPAETAVYTDVDFEAVAEDPSEPDVDNKE